MTGRTGGSTHRPPQEARSKGAAPSGNFRGMNVPDDLRYTSDHEWTRSERAGLRIGITDYAQDALGDIVFVQLPDPGTRVTAGDSFAEIESTKSVSDVYAPVTGTVTDINTDLSEAPQRLNEDPYGEGWLCVIAPEEGSESDRLLDAQGYRKLIEG